VHHETKDGDEALYLEIMDFFCKVFPERMDYTLGRLASFLWAMFRTSTLHLHGPGSNGVTPSNCSRHLRRVLLQAADRSSNVARRRDRPGELARTKPAAIVLQEFRARSERLNVGVMKEFRRGDTIICRALYSDPPSFGLSSRWF
jgi:hypothetical protein